MCRYLISTIVFGLCIQIPNVKYVLHWRPSETTLDYWQEVGRCARNIHLVPDGKAVLYTPRNSFRRLDPLFKNTIGDGCITAAILSSIKVGPISEEDIEACCGGEDCCSTCSNLKPETVHNTNSDPEDSNDSSSTDEWNNV